MKEKATKSLGRPRRLELGKATKKRGRPSLLDSQRGHQAVADLKFVEDVCGTNCAQFARVVRLAVKRLHVQKRTLIAAYDRYKSSFIREFSYREIIEQSQFEFVYQRTMEQGFSWALKYAKSDALNKLQKLPEKVTSRRVGQLLLILRKDQNWSVIAKLHEDDVPHDWFAASRLYNIAYCGLLLAHPKTNISGAGLLQQEIDTNAREYIDSRHELLQLIQDHPETASPTRAAVTSRREFDKSNERLMRLLRKL